MTSIESSLIEKKPAPTRNMVEKASIFERTQPLRQPQRILWTALLLAITADWLFYGRPVGLSAPFYLLLLLAAVFTTARREKLAWQPGTSWLLLPLLFLGTMLAVRASPLLIVANLFTIGGLLAYLLYFFTTGGVSGLTGLGAVLLPLRVSGHALVKAAPLVRENVEMGRMWRHGRRRLLPILRGLLLALPVVGFFTLFLAAADMVFADKLQEILGLAFLEKLMERLWRVVLILGLTWFGTGALLVMLQRRANLDDEGILEKAFARLPQIISLGFIETCTILGTLNALFAAFVAVQFKYLFGGPANIEAAGYTFSSYARRGFFELVAVAFFSMGLILSLNWISARADKGQVKLFNLLSSLLVGFVLVMLVSAYTRMRYYELAYGFTLLRLLVYLGIVWLAFLLIWFLDCLWRRPERFAWGLVLAALGFIITLNLINPDLYIARQNLGRYEVGGELDAAYLTRLSADATPALLDALALTADDEELQLLPACAQWMLDYEDAECLATAHTILWRELAARLEKERPGSPLTWNYAYWLEEDSRKHFTTFPAGD